MRITIKEITNFYVKQYTCNLAMEECAELIQAINKCLRYPEEEQRKEKLLEEMVDVEIMLNHLLCLFNIDLHEHEKILERKTERVLRRYEQNKKKS